MAMIDPLPMTSLSSLSVEVRGHRETAVSVKLPFYKRPEAVKSTNSTHT
jgi:hypothetical protein